MSTAKTLLEKAISAKGALQAQQTQTAEDAARERQLEIEAVCPIVDSIGLARYGKKPMYWVDVLSADDNVWYLSKAWNFTKKDTGELIADRRTRTRGMYNGLDVEMAVRDAVLEKLAQGYRVVSRNSQPSSPIKSLSAYTIKPTPPRAAVSPSNPFAALAASPKASNIHPIPPVDIEKLFEGVEERAKAEEAKLQPKERLGDALQRDPKRDWW
jgi:hypothetical protein